MTRFLVGRGLLAIGIGIVAIAWPGITIDAVAIVFAIGAFTMALMQGTRAFTSDRVGPVIGHLLLAALDAAGGVVALAWPDITAYALTIWIGAWAVVRGVVEFGLVFRSNETAGDRALFGLGGLVSIALGTVLLARPDIGAYSLAEVFGLFSFVFGISALVGAAWTHGARADLRKVAGSDV